MCVKENIQLVNIIQIEKSCDIQDGNYLICPKQLPSIRGTRLIREASFLLMELAIISIQQYIAKSFMEESLLISNVGEYN